MNQNKSKYILITYHSNWADEFDLYGFIVTTPEQFKKHLDVVKNSFPQESYFGTNEAVNYKSFNDYKRCFKKPIELPENEFESLKRLGLLKYVMMENWFEFGTMALAEPNEEESDE